MQRLKVMSCFQACLASAVFNLYDTDRKRYTTAKKPGEKPITTDEDLSVRNQAEEELLPKPEQPAVSSQRGGYNLRSTSRPFNQLHLTTRLAPNVFLGGCALLREMSCFHRLFHMMSDSVSQALNNAARMHAFVWLFQAILMTQEPRLWWCFPLIAAEAYPCPCSVAGRAAAVRLAVSPAAIEDAKQEAAVYEQLKHLQGRCVPRLLAHGPTLKGGAYFVATEYVKVKVATWYSVHIIFIHDVIAIVHPSGCKTMTAFNDAPALADRVSAGARARSPPAWQVVYGIQSYNWMTLAV